MSKRALSTVLSLALLAPAAASADYVCSVRYFSSGGAPSVPARMRVVYGTSATCSGALTTLWYCHKDADVTTTYCASLFGGRYERDELLALYESLTRAADSGQSVWPSTTTCNGGAPGCGYAPFFGQ